MLEESHIRATIGLLRAEANRLEGLLPPVGYQTVFDPRIDLPPVTPMVKGTVEQEAYCTLLLFGGLAMHELEHGRGASDAESRFIAARASYETANRAWNGWSPRGWQRDELGLRTIDVEGLARLQRCYDLVGRTLPEDLQAFVDGREL